MRLNCDYGPYRPRLSLLLYTLKMHLLVLSHGMWGSPTHVETVKAVIEERFPHVTTLNLDINQGLHTYDGIDTCGDRAVAKIQENLEGVDYISFLGYSLGGLIVRYAIGKLYLLGIFEKVKPIFYISMACPHLGTAKPLTIGMVFNWLQDVYLARTGAQFSVSDQYDASDERPLLVIMADPQHCFMAGLALFHKRILFANVINDRSVRFTTASIVHTNPYLLYPSVPTDEKHPHIVTYDPKGEIFHDEPTMAGYAQQGVKAAAIAVIFPIWIVVASSALGYFSLRARIFGPPTATEWVSQAPKEEIESSDEVVEHPKVRGNRAYMIHHLNNLTWQKVHVEIKNVLNSHASIIQRRGINEEYADVFEYMMNHCVQDFAEFH